MSASGFDLTGKTALVTGGGLGMGRGMALALARAGADVAVVSRTPADLEAVAAEIRSLGRHALTAPADVSNVDAIQRMVDQVAREFGRIDILVTAAGIILRNSAVGYTPDDWDRLMNINLKGRYFTCQAVGEHMLAQGSGSIINLGSLTTTVGIPGVAIYAIANGGIAQMTRTLAAEWAPGGVRVNCIAPGTFITRTTEGLLADPEQTATRLRRIPMGRFGDPASDLDGAVVYLASPAASYVTGVIFYIDGGSIAAY